MPASRLEELMAIAEDHDGLISTVDARNAGLSPKILVKMADRGRLERLHRGVYRLALYPAQSEGWAKLHRALAWSKSSHGPHAAISHESALALFGLSDVLPKQVHITVPSKTRFQRRVIPSSIVVHKADLTNEDVTTYQGVRTTTPERSILDVASGRGDFAWQALDDARSLGFLTTAAARRLSKHLRENFDKPLR